jgi:mannose-6-phosphate isomerase-like protein (cupin superfamily)
MPDRSRSKIDLATSVVGIDRNGGARVLENKPGPPQRIDGLTVGAPLVSGKAPHGGEMHPDGDELLFLVSGSITVVLEDEEPPRRVQLGPGDALVVPRGVWHQVLISVPSQMVHITPGPGGEHRPHASSD